MGMAGPGHKLGLLTPNEHALPSVMKTWILPLLPAAQSWQQDSQGRPLHSPGPAEGDARVGGRGGGVPRQRGRRDQGRALSVLYLPRSAGPIVPTSALRLSEPEPHLALRIYGHRMIRRQREERWEAGPEGQMKKDPHSPQKKT